MTPAQLRAIREQLGWSQAEAGRQLGLSLRAYKYYEAGENSGGAKLDHVPKPIARSMLGFKFQRDWIEIADDGEAE